MKNCFTCLNSMIRQFQIFKISKLTYKYLKLAGIELCKKNLIIFNQLALHVTLYILIFSADPNLEYFSIL